jgi:hypothetical protein
MWAIAIVDGVRRNLNTEVSPQTFHQFSTGQILQGVMKNVRRT